MLAICDTLFCFMLKCRLEWVISRKKEIHYLKGDIHPWHMSFANKGLFLVLNWLYIPDTSYIYKSVWATLGIVILESNKKCENAQISNDWQARNILILVLPSSLCWWGASLFLSTHTSINIWDTNRTPSVLIMDKRVMFGPCSNKHIILDILSCWLKCNAPPLQ